MENSDGSTAHLVEEGALWEVEDVEHDAQVDEGVADLHEAEQVLLQQVLAVQTARPARRHRGHVVRQHPPRRLARPARLVEAVHEHVRHHHLATAAAAKQVLLSFHTQPPNHPTPHTKKGGKS